MSYLYAISDIHGCKEEFDQAVSLMDLSEGSGNLLILCGDYIDSGHRNPAFYDYVREFCERHSDRVIALMGNHEEDYLRCLEEGSEPPVDPKTHAWLKGLEPYYRTERQIFVHAGVDEEAGDLWHLASEPWFFVSKFPAEFGTFYMDIIAGHVGTYAMCGENRVFWDGESHFYLDGTTERSGILPILKYDTETGAYHSFRKEEAADGTSAWVEYDVKVEVW